MWTCIWRLSIGVTFKLIAYALKLTLAALSSFLSCQINKYFFLNFLETEQSVPFRSTSPFPLVSVEKFERKNGKKGKSTLSLLPLANFPISFQPIFGRFSHTLSCKAICTLNNPQHPSATYHDLPLTCRPITPLFKIHPLAIA